MIGPRVGKVSEKAGGKCMYDGESKQDGANDLDGCWVHTGVPVNENLHPVMHQFRGMQRCCYVGRCHTAVCNSIFAQAQGCGQAAFKSREVRDRDR